MQDKDHELLALLVTAGEWEGLMKNSEYRNMSRSGRIVILRSALKNRERELVRAFSALVAHSPERAQDFHNKKIKPLWEYQDFLDQCQMYYETGGDAPNDAPKELLKHLE